MEGSIKCSSSRTLQKLERKVIEKNRRNQMKFLYSRLYSLVPPHFISKGCGASDRVDRTIEYIQSLKDNVEVNKKKKEKLLSQKRLRDNTKINSNMSYESLDIQIHEIGYQLDAVLVTGLNNYSSFCDVVQLLGRYSDEVTLANFSSNGHSTFHIRQKKIEADDVCKRLKNLGDGYSSSIKELPLNDASLSFCNELVEPDLSIWDFDFQSSVWGCDLGVMLQTSG
ncbi:hypothetical protein M8C21_011766 [Ambrosia artemisiifolia]|uniref:BHLH domain-containing protein n=1 Tax=Ambrosia artemisiifolia TaxID=4212 RepID=A0AAD5CYR6_AMBAR|nr:hypothetical protein M8C21_011766 [Ambrosia artemisiifolia]